MNVLVVMQVGADLRVLLTFGGNMSIVSPLYIGTCSCRTRSAFRTTATLACSTVALTLALSADELLEEVDGDALRLRQVRADVDGAERVHLVLGAELGGELGGRYACLVLFANLHRVRYLNPMKGLRRCG